jgi:hypothetical protein
MWVFWIGYDCRGKSINMVPNNTRNVTAKMQSDVMNVYSTLVCSTARTKKIISIGQAMSRVHGTHHASSSQQNNNSNTHHHPCYFPGFFSTLPLPRRSNLVSDVSHDAPSPGHTLFAMSDGGKSRRKCRSLMLYIGQPKNRIFTM